MVAFSQMKSVTAISFVVASTVSAMKGVLPDRGQAMTIVDDNSNLRSDATINRDTAHPQVGLNKSSENTSHHKAWYVPTPLQQLAIGTGVAVAGTAAATSIMRGERNENEAFQDLASGEGLNIKLMTRDEAADAGITIPETDAEVHAHIFAKPENDNAEMIADQLKQQLEDNDIFKNLEVSDTATIPETQLDGIFGDNDILVIQDIDPTSVNQTAGMICLIGLGVLSILVLILRNSELKNLNHGYFPTIGLALLGVGASISAGMSLHHMSAGNWSSFGHSGIGFLCVLVAMVVLFTFTRKGHGGALANVVHVACGLALVGGFAMLTNLVGEAVGENVIDQIKQTLVDNAEDASSGLSAHAAFPFGLLFVGLMWFFVTFFKKADNADGALASKNVVLALGALGVSVAVVGGAHLIAMDASGAGINCIALAILLLGVIYMAVRHGGFKNAGNAVLSMFSCRKR